MHWKEQLRFFEINKQWDQAINYMQKIIHDYPNDMDAYIFTNFLLMNLLVEEGYDDSKHDYCASLLKRYFDVSYALFSKNPDYLFCTGITAVMAEWYLGIQPEDWQAMLQKSFDAEPHNILYQWAYYSALDLDKPDEKAKAIPYAQLIIHQDPKLMKALHAKGAFGDYLFDCMQGWAKHALDIYPYDQQNL